MKAGTNMNFRHLEDTFHYSSAILIFYLHRVLFSLILICDGKWISKIILTYQDMSSQYTDVSMNIKRHSPAAVALVSKC